MRKSCIALVLGLVVSGMSPGAYSLEELVGKVTYIEPTYMPNSIRFNIDGGNATCPAGKAITWDRSNIDNHQAVYSTLLASLMGAKTVRVYIDDGDTSCKGKYLHILAN